MFAYCENNPINRIDYDGHFWKQIKQWCQNAWNKVKQVASKIFGASSSTTATLSKSETPVIPDPSPITFKTGSKVTRTVSSSGDSSKPVSVYAIGNLDDQLFSSSAGIKFNVSNVTAKFNLAGNDIGIYGSISNKNATDSLGLRVNLKEFKIGISSSSSVTYNNDTYTDYWDLDVSGLIIAYAYLYITSGEVSAPYAYAIN